MDRRKAVRQEREKTKVFTLEFTIAKNLTHL